MTEDYEGDVLNLFRVRNGVGYSNRAEMFHVPKEDCDKVSATRFSIEGYPSLYLSTNVELSWNELDRNTESSASLFKINRRLSDNRIRVIEMAIKPQDFLEKKSVSVDGERFNSRGRRVFNSINTRFNDREFRSIYLHCYPLIAACSFIRLNNSGFYAEYIIPQLLMLWVRKHAGSNLCGIRYFSCKDVASSDIGFNYVFPINNFKFVSSYKQALL